MQRIKPGLYLKSKEIPNAKSSKIVQISKNSAAKNITLADLAVWTGHQGKVCCGRTPLETLLNGKKFWAEKNLAKI